MGTHLGMVVRHGRRRNWSANLEVSPATRRDFVCGLLRSRR